MLSWRANLENNAAFLFYFFSFFVVSKAVLKKIIDQIYYPSAVFNCGATLADDITNKFVNG